MSKLSEQAKAMATATAIFGAIAFDSNELKGSSSLTNWARNIAGPFIFFILNLHNYLNTKQLGSH